MKEHCQKPKKKKTLKSKFSFFKNQNTLNISWIIYKSNKWEKQIKKKCRNHNQEQEKKKKKFQSKPYWNDVSKTTHQGYKTAQNTKKIKINNK